MSELLLVHGAWQSTACWDEVIFLLGSFGKRGAAVALTGVGTDTRHLNRQVRLSTHIEDVVRAIDSGDGPFVLVGTSGGNPIFAAGCGAAKGQWRRSTGSITTNPEISAPRTPLPVDNECGQ